MQDVVLAVLKQLERLRRVEVLEHRPVVVRERERVARADQVRVGHARVSKVVRDRAEEHGEHVQRLERAALGDARVHHE